MRKLLIITAAVMLLAWPALAEYKIYYFTITDVPTSATPETDDYATSIFGRPVWMTIDITSTNSDDMDIDLTTVAGSGASVASAQTLYSADDVSADAQFDLTRLGLVLAGDTLRLSAADSGNGDGTDDLKVLLVVDDLGGARVGNDVNVTNVISSSGSSVSVTNEPIVNIDGATVSVTNDVTVTGSVDIDGATVSVTNDVTVTGSVDIDGATVSVTNDVTVTGSVDIDGESVSVTNIVTAEPRTLTNGKGWLVNVSTTSARYTLPTDEIANEISIYNTGVYTIHAAVNCTTNVFDALLVTTNAVPIRASSTYTFRGGIATSVVVGTLSGISTNVYIGAY